MPVSRSARSGSPPWPLPAGLMRRPILVPRIAGISVSAATIVARTDSAAPIAGPYRNEMPSSIIPSIAITTTMPANSTPSRPSSFSVSSAIVLTLAGSTSPAPLRNWICANVILPSWDTGAPRANGSPTASTSGDFSIVAIVRSISERVTTRIRLIGGGAEGLGEDVSPYEGEEDTLHAAGPVLPLAGEWTLGSLCARLAELDQWPAPPQWDVARPWRNWAF